MTAADRNRAALALVQNLMGREFPDAPQGWTAFEAGARYERVRQALQEIARTLEAPARETTAADYMLDPKERRP